MTKRKGFMTMPQGVQPAEGPEGHPDVGDAERGAVFEVFPELSNHQHSW